MEDLIWIPFQSQSLVMVQFKAGIKEDVALIPTEIVKAALLSTKKRVVMLVECQGESLKGRRVMPGLKI